jgi:hypothetical protein
MMDVASPMTARADAPSPLDLVIVHLASFPDFISSAPSARRPTRTGNEGVFGSSAVVEREHYRLYPVVSFY